MHGAMLCCGVPPMQAWYGPAVPSSTVLDTEPCADAQQPPAPSQVLHQYRLVPAWYRFVTHATGLVPLGTGLVPLRTRSE